eukprot:TRINITY_DN6872_c0_g1_i1.p1 TRINITY_DN6872_c0_g1~~TRINITY_DN6872_c0_g1_i1.p1  ORF type:complete len:99 (-),score=24.83 TRINITY_DN6872_c0_g1_i1:115-411(-)
MNKGTQVFHSEHFKIHKDDLEYEISRLERKVILLDMERVQNQQDCLELEKLRKEVDVTENFCDKCSESDNNVQTACRTSTSFGMSNYAIQAICILRRR